jgi:hypothetical protein
MINQFYTYAYLRKDGTPYYIGKGKGKRAWSSHGRWIGVPKDPSRILILKQGLSEEEAFKHEKYMIAVFGRKDLGTGILRNKTDGGEGISGHKHSENAKLKIRFSNKGKLKTKEHRDKLAISARGFKWFNNGSKNMQAREHPGVGWVKGRVLDWDSPRNSGMKWYHCDGRQKMFKECPGDGGVLGRVRPKGKKYYNNGTEHVLTFECPGDGWILGRLKRK